MKRKILYFLFALEGVLCILLYAGRVAFSSVFTVAVAFPFEQIGDLLRALSLSGILGNLFAVVLYIAVSVIPLIYLLIKKQRRRLHMEDSLLVVLSGLLFFVLYLMINPAEISTYLGSPSELGFGKAVLGIITYSLITGYVVLRLLRLFFAADANREKLQRYLKILMIALNVILVYTVFGSCLGNAMDSFAALQAATDADASAPTIGFLFLALRYLISALPYLLDILIVFSILHLLDALLIDRYSKAAVLGTKKLSQICAGALTITVISNMAFNLLQLLFMRRLSNVDTSVNIPLMSIIFALATLLLAQFIQENKQLKDDNDMFI